MRTVRGTYKAYGQRLDIEQGVVRFVGPIDNPSLTILAIRPKLTQRVGVQISGSQLSPIVRLYAEPDLPDAEKLAWLVLGRSPDGGGAEAALMQPVSYTHLDVYKRQGLKRYDAELVQRLARLQPGVDYDQKQLVDAQLRLSASGFFDSAFVNLDTSTCLLYTSRCV